MEKCVTLIKKNKYLSFSSLDDSDERSFSLCSNLNVLESSVFERLIEFHEQKIVKFLHHKAVSNPVVFYLLIERFINSKNYNNVCAEGK